MQTRDRLDPGFKKNFAAFLRLCRLLVARGQAYAAVVLCHELTRFLFPAEPTLGFVHRDPVAFIRKKLNELVRVGAAWQGAVRPYPMNLSRWNDSGEQDGSLEDRTGHLYTELWKKLDTRTLWEESYRLIRMRLTEETVRESIRGKNILDMGCGSGRYTLALGRLGARSVLGVDVDREAWAEAQRLAQAHRLSVQFREANFLSLPVADEAFDFIFCNGTLHHSRSIPQGLREMNRVLKPGGEAFLYLYAKGGIYWQARKDLRRFFRSIPASYTAQVLEMMGMPRNRFIFQDIWYVPREYYTARERLESLLSRAGFSFKKAVSQNTTDLDRAIRSGVPGARRMWGDGEHRYLLKKRALAR